MAETWKARERAAAKRQREPMAMELRQLQLCSRSFRGNKIQAQRRCRKPCFLERCRKDEHGIQEDRARYSRRSRRTLSADPQKNQTLWVRSCYIASISNRHGTQVQEEDTSERAGFVFAVVRCGLHAMRKCGNDMFLPMLHFCHRNGKSIISDHASWS